MTCDKHGKRIIHVVGCIDCIKYLSPKYLRAIAIRRAINDTHHPDHYKRMMIVGELFSKDHP